MAVVPAILLIIVIVAIVWWYVRIIRINKYLKKYPGPPPLPIIGNAHKFNSCTDFLPVVMEFLGEYGSTVKIMLGYEPRLIVADHKLAEFIHGSSVILEKSNDYIRFHSWLGTGLLTSSSEKWKKHRRLLTPTFHFQILEQFIDVFNSQGTILVKKLSKKIGKGPFDICPYIGLCTLDIICEAAMGISINAQNNSESEYVKSVKEMCRIIIERTFNPIKMWDFLFVFTKDYHLEKKALEVLHSHTNSVIKRRRVQLHSIGAAAPMVDAETGIKRRLAFLDVLLQCSVDGNPLSDKSIREEVDTFMFEGHDTTSWGINFTLDCLARHPEIQDKVVKELQEILSEDKETSPTYQDLQNMKYLEMVIKETMRLFPPVPIYARQLEEDVEYDGDVLPKGLTLAIFPFGLHRREELFPDPEKFDPERFSPENSVGRPPYAYIPFSAGARNCIGQRFAMLEMKSTISKVLRNFEILPELGHKPLLAAAAVLKSDNGLMVRLKERII